MQVVVTVSRIAEAFMLPALEQILTTFPFEILGFHADNVSEYMNYSVSELLETLRIELTKSRPRHSNDNALVESKNGSVMRKMYGYSHIPQQHAKDFDALDRDSGLLYRYFNFHRPCYFPPRSPAKTVSKRSSTFTRT